MKTIAISGSSGFVGKHLKQHLQDSKNQIISLDIKDGTNLLNEKIIKQISFFDIFIHLAARSFVPDSYINPISFFRDNYILTLHALELCRKHNASMIYFSSYVYGKPGYLPIDEKHPTDGFNPYAQSKLICEELCKSYNRHFQMPLVIIRPFNIYGPGQDSHFLIPKIVEMVRRGRIELENPDPKRDFIHIRDVADFIDNTIEAIREINFDVFNLGTGVSYSVDEIVKLAIGDNKIPVIYNKKLRANEINNTLCNNKKARHKFNWSPLIGLKEGIAEMLSN